MDRVAPDEKVTKTFKDGTYLLRTKTLDKKGHTQYRYYHICDRCCKKTRVENTASIPPHKCTQDGQQQITSFFTGIDNTKLIFYKFVCKTNLSLSSAASPELKCLVGAFFRAGQNSILNQLNQTTKASLRIPSFTEIFIWESRQTLARSIIKYANNLKDATLSNLKPFKYISLCLDGGSINAVPLLDIIVQHPFFKGKPLLIEARSRFDGTRNSFINIIKSVLENKIEPYSFIVTSFNGDNLAAQKAAFNDCDDSILKQKDLKKICAGAIYFPCVCHVAALGFHDCISETQLADIHEDLRSFCKMFRAKPVQQYFETICPPFCPTRWTNCFRIAEWFINNRNDIQNMFLNPTKAIKALMKQNNRFPEVFVKYIPVFYSLLYCYNEFINSLEGDNIPAAYIWPLFHSFKDESIQILSVAESLNIHCSSWITRLIDCISKRLASTYGAPLLKTLWYLTPPGRAKARNEMRECGIDLDLEPLEDSPDQASIQPPSIRIDCEKFRLFLSEALVDINHMAQSINNAFEDETPVTDGSSDCEFEEEINEEPLGEIAEMNGFQELNCTITEIYEFLESRAYEVALGNPLFVDDVILYSRNIVTYYRRWITDPVAKAWQLDLMSRGAWHFWKEFQIHSSEWKRFADFAMRHLSIVANSASCERAFWREARQKPANRFRTKDELLIARVLISTLE